MICPLQDIQLAEHYGVDATLFVPCQDDCAWYDTDKQQCEIKSIRQALEKLAIGIKVSGGINTHSY